MSKNLPVLKGSMHLSWCLKSARNAYGIKVVPPVKLRLVFSSEPLLLVEDGVTGISGMQRKSASPWGRASWPQTCVRHNHFNAHRGGYQAPRMPSEKLSLVHFYTDPTELNWAEPNCHLKAEVNLPQAVFQISWLFSRPQTASVWVDLKEILGSWVAILKSERDLFSRYRLIVNIIFCWRRFTRTIEIPATLTW